jgi:hypothetical protein
MAKFVPLLFDFVETGHAHVSIFDVLVEMLDNVAITNDLLENFS